MNLRWDARALQPIAQHLRNRVNRLLTNPFIGVVTTNPQIRILPPTRYPYRVYYTVQGNDVVILHIRHTARSTPEDLGL